jgi:PAS domain-containing protein
VAAPESKSLLIILAREMASNLATPMFVVDTKGTLVFYNEAAETLLGQSFSVTGPLSRDEWGGEMFHPEDLDGNPISLDDLPLVEVIRERKPAHARFRITGIDGVRRDIAATSFPLFARTDELAGALAVFWEQEP